MENEVEQPNKSVLIVDDEYSIRVILSRKLEEDGYNCVIVSNGNEALETAATQSFDLMILDVKMPGISGLEVLSQVTTNYPDTCVVMSTAVADGSTAVEAMKLGAYDYVTKPFDLDDLSIRVEKALDKKRLEQENRDFKLQLAEQALVESEDKFKRLLETMSDGYFVIQDNSLIFFNEKSARMLGFEPEEIEGKPIFKLLPSDIFNNLSEIHKQRLEGKKTPGVYETLMPRKDGTRSLVELSVKLITQDGRPAVSVLMRDISERRKAEEALRDSEEKYKSIFENANDVIVYYDLSGKVIEVNSGIKEITGYGPEEIIGNNFTDLGLLNEQSIQTVSHLVEEVLCGINPESREIEINHKDGHTVYIEASPSRLNRGDEEGLLIVIRDITERKRSEEALRESEEYFRALIDNSYDVIAIVNSEGNIKYISPSVSRVLGYDPAEVMGGSGMIFVHPNEIESAVEAFSQLLVFPKNVYSMILRVLHKDGSFRIVETVARNFLDDPAVDGIIVNYRDITDSKQMEEALIESEERYRTLVEDSNDLVYSVDAEGIVKYIGPQVLRYGYAPEEIISKSLIEFVDPEDHERIALDFAKLMDTGSEFVSHFRMIAKNGTKYWFEDHGRVKRDESGNIIGLAGFLRDITDRKQAEEALMESEERYRTLIEDSNDLAYAVDAEGIVIYIGAQVLRYGYTPEEVVSKSLLEFIDPEDHEVVTRDFISSIEKRKEFLAQFKLIAKNGEKYWVEDHGSVQKDELGNSIGLFGFLRDITERKKAEAELKEYAEAMLEQNQQLNVAKEQLAILNRDLEKIVEERTIEIERLLEQKDAFIAQLGHDLKNPITPLVTLLPLVRKQEKDPKLQELLDVTIHDVNYMKELVIKTLQLARLNSAQIEFAMEEIELFKEIERIITGNRLLLKKTNINIENRIDKDIIAYADKLRFEELTNNLINNAIKFTPRAGMITIDAKKQKEFVVVSVKDTGLGMTKDQLEMVFHEFYKGDKSRQELDSSGLGLAICKRIVEKHGGHIWVESDGLDQGSTFSFTLPVLKKPSKKIHSE